MVLLIALFVLLMNRTRFGTYIYAVGGNRESAHLSGVNMKTVEIAVFTHLGLSGGFRGAGAVRAHVLRAAVRGRGV